MMISTLPPPRPASVNSSVIPLASPVSVHKPADRFPRERFQNTEDVTKSTHSLTVSLERRPDTDFEMGGVDDDDSHLDFPTYSSPQEIQFRDLPIEIHEAIIDNLFGERIPGSNNIAHGRPDARSWIRSLRHPRRKALSNLALITPVWRDLVQERIYRHIKVKGTKDGLAECEEWFQSHPHLVRHVRHIEYWIPVWGNRAHKNVAPHLREMPPIRRYLNEDTGLFGVNAFLPGTVPDWELSDNRSHGLSNFTFHVASHNASLEDIFQHVKGLFSGARILTLEAGHCKKPPLMKHFAADPSGLTGDYHLEQLPNIRTFFMRGAWNIMRDYRHWNTISEALPSLREWHCAYAKPKIEGYHTICGALSTLSSSIVHLDISLEGFHSKDQSLWINSMSGHHNLCRLLGQIVPRLEHLTFTGYVCGSLFNTARKAMLDRPQDTRLRSVDLVVKTCCREPNAELLSPLTEEPPSITNMAFIESFEKLVLGAIRSLDTYLDLSYIRIRFIDLDSPCAVLNPYFQMVDNKCTGLWSHDIVQTLAQVRPSAHFVELSDGIFTQYGANNVIIGAVYPRIRPLSINASTYKILSDAAKS